MWQLLLLLRTRKPKTSCFATVHGEEKVFHSQSLNPPKSQCVTHAQLKPFWMCSRNNVPMQLPYSLKVKKWTVKFLSSRSHFDSDVFVSLNFFQQSKSQGKARRQDVFTSLWLYLRQRTHFHCWDDSQWDSRMSIWKQNCRKTSIQTPAYWFSIQRVGKQWTVQLKEVDLSNIGCKHFFLGSLVAYLRKQERDQTWKLSSSVIAHLFRVFWVVHIQKRPFSAKRKGPQTRRKTEPTCPSPLSQKLWDGLTCERNFVHWEIFLIKAGQAANDRLTKQFRLLN